MKKAEYARELRELQIELTKLQRYCCVEGARRILVVFEGRDAAGKDGTIKGIMQHLSPREVRVVALGKPTVSEQGAWYFSRWVAELPIAGEFVLFNRSWYNRAGVERVMGFATAVEVEAFLDHVPTFERLLADGGIELLKYYLDISREEQTRRLEQRASDPLTQWKSSPIDGVALEKFEEYSAARDEMLLRTHSEHAPWTVVKADNKRPARLAVIRDILARVEFPEKRHELLETDPDRIRTFAPSMIGARWLAY